MKLAKEDKRILPLVGDGGFRSGVPGRSRQSGVGPLHGISELITSEQLIQKIDKPIFRPPPIK